MAEHIRFTKAKIEELPLPKPGTRKVYWDDEVTGLALRITDTGARSFYTVRRVKGGKPEWNRIGPFPEITVAVARLRAMEAGAKLARGESVAAERRDLKKDPTFGELFEWWHELPAKTGRKSEAYRRDTRRQVDSYLAELVSRKASAITRSDVRRIHEALGRDHGQYQANRTLALIRAVYNKAIARDKITCTNPAKGIEAFPESSRERRLLPHEIGAFLEAVAAEPNRTIQDYVLLSLFTGARKGNVLAMRWADVSIEGRTWQIGRTKNGRPQVIPLGEPEIEILHRRKTAAGEADVYVFPGDGATGHLADPKKGWRRIVERAGLAMPKPKTKSKKKSAADGAASATKQKHDRNNEDLRIHDLRRTLGSFMADAEVPLNVIGKALNNMSPQATLIYSRLTLDPVRQAKGKAMALMMGGLDA